MSGTRGMWACVLVAVASAAIWSVASPWFQPPDEQSHVGYVKYFAETGHLPRSTPVPLAPVPPDELRTAVHGVPFSTQGTPTYDPARSAAVHQASAAARGPRLESDAGSAPNNPPLYYLIEALPYRATLGANLFDRILAMRLVSSLLAGAVVALIFLFLRELLPGTRWAWTVGALAVALQPVFGFMGGSVNPDVLVWVAAAGVFYASARILRRGLSWRRAGGLALALAAGLLTKGAMLGLLPGVAVVLGIGAWRASAGAWPRRALAAAGAAVAAAGLPALAWIGFTRTVHGTVAGAGTTGGVSTHANVAAELGYVWQYYLPRLPFQNDQFTYYPLWEIYFKGFVGRFGHFFFDFPSWVDWLGLLVALAVLALAGRALWLHRAAVRARLPELAAYLAMIGGLLVLLAVAGYQYKLRQGANFEQTRYLLPLLPLYAALVAVAARGAGRWGREVGLALVGLFVVQDVFALLLTVSHYYA